MLRSFANKTDAAIILFGTGELRDYVSASAQLSRRIKTIRFEHYRSSKTELIHFCSVLHSMSEKSPLKLGFDFTKHIEYFHRQTLGCVGMLKTWFIDANKLAITSNNPKLRLLDFKQSQLSNLQLKPIVDELVALDKKLGDPGNKSFKSVLMDLPSKKQTDDSANENSSTPSTKQSTTKTKPGERKPKRDPIGLVDSVGSVDELLI